MNTNMKTKHCPMCKEVVVSDATAAISCAVCAMSVDEATAITTRKDGNTVYFCAEECLQLYEGYEGNREAAIQNNLLSQSQKSSMNEKHARLASQEPIVKKMGCCR